MQTGQIKMKAAILVLFSMLAYSNAQNCSTSCVNSTTCGWTCEDSSNEILDADVTGCSNTPPTCSYTTGTSGNATSGECSAGCVSKTGGSGSSKLEFLTPLLVLGTLARLCFYP
ncbi:uncharacterized protein LOC110462975 [Mizuhopecten yessoensis]|uniref:uncharacterized protein LOC110462975 n=1 Tax=Mizuhopecten yessoensis TaxID=6573 RepID=UPI000B458529|nr:uncharacterized protein LOC110462975 [Mizuhopecten yessoensis]